MAEISVVLVDDHSVLREGLRQLLDREADIQVVGEAGDERSACDVVEQTNPDVVLLDLVLQASSGLSTLGHLLQRRPDQRVLLFSAYSNEEDIAEGLALGALGYFSKSQPVSELTEAIRAVYRGEPYLSPQVSRAALERRQQQPQRQELAVEVLAPLSTREREVFRLLIRGLNNAAIANELSISRRTVETHRARVMRKLQLRSLSELFRFAAERGLLEQDRRPEQDFAALT